MSSKNTRRLQFEISSPMDKELNELMDEFGIRTKKDLFNNSISLLQWASRELKRGRIVGSINPDTDSYKELSMPIFNNIEQKSSEITARTGTC